MFPIVVSSHTPVISAVQPRGAFIGSKNLLSRLNFPLLDIFGDPGETSKRPYRFGVYDQRSRRVDDETVGGRRPHRRVATWSEETTILLVHFAQLYCLVVCTAAYLCGSVYLYSSVRWCVIARPLYTLCLTCNWY